MSDFIIFYDDGSEIAANASTLEKVKPFGVVCIVQERADGHNQILYGKDYYSFSGEHWIVLDMMGVIDHLVHKPESIKKFIVGRTVDNQTFYNIYDKAKTHV